MLIDISTPEGRHSGINSIPRVTCGNLFSVVQTKIPRLIGGLSLAMVNRIYVCLSGARAANEAGARPRIGAGRLTKARAV